MSANIPHLLKLMESNVNIHSHIAEILHAKASEAEQSKNWLCARPDHELEYEGSLEVHEQIVEMIDGITKTQSGLNRSLKALLGSGERSQLDFSDLFQGMGTDD
ncbi:hypothetical protein [Marinicrinis lubricantis]|uniref:Restriction endonuclease subunit S n=1 Tax=Marinicrinis lubricantis TaxID=2086470 RepID=A0ABW1IUU8_9BACL